jgi:hypothetical protein
MPECAVSTFDISTLDISALDLLERSRESLRQAGQAHDVVERYLHAQLGALRAGAALVAARSGSARGSSRQRFQPGGRTGDEVGDDASDEAGGGAEAHRPSSGPADLWGLLAAVAPEMGEWADFFALSTARRIHIVQGHTKISTREADDLLRQAETFVDLVAGRLGMPPHSGHRDLLIPTVRA